MPASQLTAQEDADAASLRLETLLSDLMQMKQNNTLPVDLPESDIYADLEVGISCLLDQCYELFETTKKSKQLTDDAKTNMDEKQMSLSNVMYEKRHIAEEIIKCKQFRSLYQNIDLVPLDDFLTRAPEEYRQDQDNPHTLMINRLNFELRERLELKNECERLKQERTKLLGENRKVEVQIDRIDKLLYEFVQATLDLEETLTKEEAKRKEQEEESATAAVSHTMDVDTQNQNDQPTTSSQQPPDVEMTE